MKVDRQDPEIQEALGAYKAAYILYSVAKKRTLNIAVASAYATDDVFNLAKQGDKTNALYLINDEAELLIKGANDV